MESPLLNLKIKESQKEIYSIGNFSYQYPVSIIDNSSFGLLQGSQGKLVDNAIAFFGISSLELSHNYMGRKNLILPIYYLNNLLRKTDANIPSVKNFDDLNIYFAPQNLSEIKSNLLFTITTHFEKFVGSDKVVRIPVSGYLETNISYINKNLEVDKINAVKPSFSISDFSTAFTLYTNKTSSMVKGSLLSFSSKKKIINKLISNMIPNYLVRDPLTRANQLFNKI